MLIEGNIQLLSLFRKINRNLFLCSGVSHSAMTDMQTIQQEGVTTTRNVSSAPKNRDFFDDFNTSGFTSRSKYEGFD